jgi:hypothetical protein
MRSRSKKRGAAVIGRGFVSLHVRQVHQVSQTGEFEEIDAGGISTSLPCCLAPLRAASTLARPPAAEPPTRKPRRRRHGSHHTHRAGGRGSGRGRFRMGGYSRDHAACRGRGGGKDSGRCGGARRRTRQADLRTETEDAGRQAFKCSTVQYASGQTAFSAPASSPLDFDPPTCPVRLELDSTNLAPRRHLQPDRRSSCIARAFFEEY